MASIFDDDEEGWEDMPVVREDTTLSGLDEEDAKKYHYVPKSSQSKQVNATGNLIDVDDLGNEWRSKIEGNNESEYTRLRGYEEDDDDVHLRTKYLFDEDKAMTPLSQMQATKKLLTEAQRIAYVGLCALICREMAHSLKMAKNKELKAAVSNLELWVMKIMGRLYYHMELETAEQKMIETLAEHGVQAVDLVPALMTTHTVANPEYDPEEAKRQAEITPPPTPVSDPLVPATPIVPEPAPQPIQTTTQVLSSTAMSSIPGVSTSLSSTDRNVTLDIRWTVLCDLFLILIADSVYDARSRVLLENVALKLGLGWLDVVKFESRVTEALEIQEDVEKMENQDVIEDVKRANRKKRYMMLGLATLGGGLVIGLSAGLLAPVIGVGLGTALGTIGISGTGTFLAGAGGAAVITTAGTLTGSGIAMKGMIKRTQQVRTFDLLPLHNNKRVNCIITVPGFLNGNYDDPRLPFSVLDPIVGDLFSVLWEPEMIRETGSALKILTGEVLSQIGQTVLQATVMTALMSALQWPIILTKLGYLIDNPWNNALDRAKAAGSVLADILIKRHLGVRPITLIGFSLGARVIFYALLQLAKQKAFGVVQDVFLLGSTLSVPTTTWLTARSAVSGRFVNAFARNDWVLNYLFRFTSGSSATIAGLRPVEGVQGLENVDVTDKISGHLSYRSFMPLILDQLGFPVSADWFDDIEEPEFEGERVVIREGEGKEEKKRWWQKQNPANRVQPGADKVQRPPAPTTFSVPSKKPMPDEEELPPREDTSSRPGTPTPQEKESSIPPTAGFDLNAIKAVLDESSTKPEELTVQSSASDGEAPAPPTPKAVSIPPIPPPTNRSESVPPDIEDTRFDGPMKRADVGRSVSMSATSSPSSLPPALSISTEESDEEVNTAWPPTSNFTLSSSPYVRSPFSPPTSASYNPFTSPSSSSASTLNVDKLSLSNMSNTTGLSFGALDGSITHTPVATIGLGGDDPWGVPALPNLDSKKAGGYENPWG